MVTFASDSHKRTHTVVAVDENGRELGSRTVAASTEGHIEVMVWARQWPERRWALENCRHLSRRLERDLLSAGEAVVQVAPKLMGVLRRSGRPLGKSDPIDALAMARAALREARLPVAQLDGPSREVKLLVDHREDLIGERTRIQNRLRWHLDELEPGYEVTPRGPGRQMVIAKVAAWLQEREGVVAELARELIARLSALSQRVNALERRIAALVRQLSPALLAVRAVAG